MATTLERKLAEMLVKDKVITREDLDRAMAQQDQTRASLGRTLIDMGITTEWEMAAALGKQLNVPFITLSHYDIDAQVLKSIPEDIVWKYKIVPVDKTGETITVALADPSNIYLIDELRILTKCQIIPVISFESDILESIARYYPQRGGAGRGGQFDEMLKEITDADVKNVKEELESEAMANLEKIEETDANIDEDGDNEAPVIQLVNMIIAEAIKLGASDIHVEPFEKVLRLRYRIDGVLQEMTPPPKKFQNAIVSRIKILSELDIAERRLPQDGRFRVKLNNRNIDFRVSIMPVTFGEKVCIRILDQSNLSLDLAVLGFDPPDMKKLEDAINAPWGMVLITGPTGSGKSTTLYSALSAINDPTMNISSCEDPVEYNLKGINQVNARPEIGLTFAAALKAFLRQDPDIIFVGEIRDLETGEIAIKAALTGHLVLSTLHTNDAPSTVQRMQNMGIEKFLITASLILVEAQRLVRRICSQCKTEYKPDPALLKSIGVEDPVQMLYKGGGCERCRGTGFKGRCGLYELMKITDNLKNAIMADLPTNKLKKVAIEEGMSTLRMAGIRKVLQGVTTIDEVLGATIADKDD